MVSNNKCHNKHSIYDFISNSGDGFLTTDEIECIFLSHLFHLVTFHNKSKLEQLLSVVLDSKLFHWIKVIFVPCFVVGVVLYAFINEQKAFSSLWYAQNIFSEIFA